MTSSASRIPNFAGVALVDILANGVAVLVIVIVLSIAARAEKEERYTEKVQEIGVVMTREFSTSLVLNKMAASPPALLHDYENSPQDQVWHPEIMPVLEFHRNVVRDPYSGTVWTRGELLQTPNTLDDFLYRLPTTARGSIRGDIYDVGTYYLLMSILRDHGIRIWHWHFMGGKGGALGSGAPGDCPPGMSFEDCVGQGGASGGDSQVNSLFEELLEGGGGDADGDSSGAWPPETMGDCPPGMDCGSGLDSTDIPEGSSLGIGQGPMDPSAMGSFPDAMMPNSSGNFGSSGVGTPGADSSNQNTFQLRLADPQSLVQPETSLPLEDTDLPSLLGALMIYISELQDYLDKNLPPTELLEDFLLKIAENLDKLDALTAQETSVIQDLHDSLEMAGRLGGPPSRFDPIPITLVPIQEPGHASLRLLSNRILLEVEARVDPDNPPEGFDMVLPRLSLNKFPDIWRGLQVALGQGSVVLTPLGTETGDEPSWRAVAYISASLNDFVVGFVYSTIDEDGFLTVLADSNRVRIDNQPITVQADVAFFGVRTWLVILYCILGAMVLLLLLFWRPGMRRSE